MKQKKWEIEEEIPEGKLLNFIKTIYKKIYCLHRRWTSIVANLRVFVILRALARGLTTWYSPHMKTITVLFYQNYSKKNMFKTCQCIWISHSDALQKRVDSIILFW